MPMSSWLVTLQPTRIGGTTGVQRRNRAACDAPTPCYVLAAQRISGFGRDVAYSEHQGTDIARNAKTANYAADTSSLGISKYVPLVFATFATSIVSSSHAASHALGTDREGGHEMS